MSVSLLEKEYTYVCIYVQFFFQEFYDALFVRVWLREEIDAEEVVYFTFHRGKGPNIANE